MRDFVDLFRELDATTRTGEKQAAMARYFADAPDGDAAWAVFFLSGRRLNRTITTTLLRSALVEHTGLPDWLIDECRLAVGDFSETAALLAGTAPSGSGAAGEFERLSLTDVVERWIKPLAGADDASARASIARSWRGLDDDGRLVFNKLVRGNFRLGVQQALLVRALSEASGVDAATITNRLAGSFEPTPAAYRRVVSSEPTPDDRARPFPFCLAHALERAPDDLGDAGTWQVEYKWDGIRAQVVRREGRVWIWSRGDELITGQFPEVAAAARTLPDNTVLDGEILAWRTGRTPGEGGALSFNSLQRRLNRVNVQPSLFDTEGVAFVAFDVLERGEDLRGRSLRERRRVLESLVPAGARDVLMLAPVLAPATWGEAETLRSSARERVNAEGLMLKHPASVYHAGRTGSRAGVDAGDPSQLAWVKWKLDPYTVDAVLTAAQPGTGRRAGLFTDYTFGVWEGERLTTIAKAYSGLSDAEIDRVDRFVRTHTTAKAGPVRMVEPSMVFELAFEGVRTSDRHRSGIALRFPRIARIRDDKKAVEADTLETLRRLLGELDARDRARGGGA
jgi:DNA ligase 1